MQKDFFPVHLGHLGLRIFLWRLFFPLNLYFTLYLLALQLVLIVGALGYGRFLLKRPFNLHLDFWKSRSWKIKVLKNQGLLQTLEKFQVLEKKARFIPYTWKNYWWQTEKKSRCAGPENFLRFETDLNFSRPWFSEIKVQIKWPYDYDREN